MRCAPQAMAPSGGERTWNGVAILARGADPVLIRDELPGDPKDRQSRYIEAAVDSVVIASLYLPNGNPQPGPKFKYKLAWFDRLIELAAGAICAIDGRVTLGFGSITFS
jgi:exodeoxyribonuclease III